MSHLTVIPGHCLHSMRFMPAQMFHTVITSPPYWNLRDYKITAELWPAMSYVPMLGCPAIEVPEISCSYGSEPTVDLFIAHTVLIFSEVHRVTRDDGTLWVNFGDSMASTGTARPQSGLKALSDKWSPRKNPRLHHRHADDKVTPKQHKPTGFKVKDMLGIPWRVAFALQAAGWTLRCDNIWNKPNPMPESVYDRPTRCHEYVFLFSKRRHYFYDVEAIKEKSSGTAHSRGAGLNPKARVPTGWDTGEGNHRQQLGRYGKNEESGDRRKVGFNDRWARQKQNESFSAAVSGTLVSTRNKRSVWTVTTKGFKGAHFATFPPDLIRPCLLAGTSDKGCCPDCGAPWKRIVAKGDPDLAHQRACGGDANGAYNGKATKDYGSAGAQEASATKARILAGMVEKVTVGWEPTCKCGRDVTVPCRVLDPFGGAFTTGYVALQHGRDATMLEVNPDYIKLGEARCANVAPYQPRKPRTPRVKVPATQMNLSI
jgi:DNA modification methylase